MGCGSRPCALAKPLAARYVTHSKFNRAPIFLLLAILYNVMLPIRGSSVNLWLGSTAASTWRQLLLLNLVIVTGSGLTVQIITGAITVCIGTPPGF
jgi:hypothetical protein